MSGRRRRNERRRVGRMLLVLATPLCLLLGWRFLPRDGAGEAAAPSSARPAPEADRSRSTATDAAGEGSGARERKLPGAEQGSTTVPAAPERDEASETATLVGTLSFDGDPDELPEAVKHLGFGERGVRRTASLRPAGTQHWTWRVEDLPAAPILVTAVRGHAEQVDLRPGVNSVLLDLTRTEAVALRCIDARTAAAVEPTVVLNFLSSTVRSDVWGDAPLHAVLEGHGATGESLAIDGRGGEILHVLASAIGYEDAGETLVLPAGDERHDVTLELRPTTLLVARIVRAEGDERTHRKAAWTSDGPLAIRFEGERVWPSRVSARRGTLFVSFDGLDRRSSDWEVLATHADLELVSAEPGALGPGLRRTVELRVR